MVDNIILDTLTGPTLSKGVDPLISTKDGERDGTRPTGGGGGTPPPSGTGIFGSDYQYGDATGKISISDITSRYVGAFTLPSLSYGRGIIAFNQATGTMFCDSSVTLDMPIMECSIPALSTPASHTDLNVGTRLQDRVTMQTKVPVLNRPQYSTTGGGGDYAVISQMFHDGTKLYVTYYGYYSGDSVYQDCVFVVDDPSNLETTSCRGGFTATGWFSSMQWICQLDASLQSELGCTHIAGGATGGTNVLRFSLGPSLHKINLSDFNSAAVGDEISAPPLMNFKNNWINGDPLNYNGAFAGGVNNNMFCMGASGGIGIIIPNTRTYMVIGNNRGFTQTPLEFVTQNYGSSLVYGEPLETGIPVRCPYTGTITDLADRNGMVFYKDKTASWVNNLGTKTGGYDVWDQQSRRPFYWLFDLDEILAASTVTEPRPYAWGVFQTPYATETYDTASGYVNNDSVTSGTYDYTNNILYLCIPTLNRQSDGGFSSYVVAAYDLSTI